MWDEDWARLGIEPTTELAAIKKAYALKLKVTRPDDDAEAYQALRSAYERVQRWLKQQQNNPSVGSEAQAAVAEEVRAEPTAALALEVPENVPVDDVPVQPEPVQDAIQRLHRLWVDEGSAALAAEWPAVHATLNELPLARQAEWSAHFAHWVVTQQDKLPDAFVFALSDHFDWQGDFRVERQIGPQLAQAVQQAVLYRRSQPAQLTEEQQALVKPLRQLDSVRGQGIMPFLIAMVLQPMLARLLTELNPRTLGLCGIDMRLRRSLEKQLRTGWLLRWGLLSGLVMAMFLLISADDLDMATTRMSVWCVAGIFWLGASHYLGLLMHVGLSLQRPGRSDVALPVQRWRRHRWQPGAGLAVLATALVLAAVGSSWDVTSAALPVGEHGKALLQMLLSTLPWVALWAGATLAWPLSAIISPACISLLAPVAALLFRWASPDDPWAAVMAVATLYVLVGAARFEDRMRGNVILDTVCRPVLNTLSLAQRWGWAFAMVPGLLTLAYLFSSRPPPRTSSLVLVWVAATLALHQLQHRAEAWALARLNRA